MAIAIAIAMAMAIGNDNGNSNSNGNGNSNGNSSGNRSGQVIQVQEEIIQTRIPAVPETTGIIQKTNISCM